MNKAWYGKGEKDFAEEGTVWERGCGCLFKKFEFFFY
jgi:hypothetical protein